MMSSPPRTVCTVFAALPRAAGAARMFTTRVLAAWKLSHLNEAAELLVSELITNAVKHAGGIVDPPERVGESAGEVPPVMLSLAVRDALLIQVWDISSAPPVRRSAGVDDVNGRGLELVESLSKEWGYESLRTGGKIIWAALDLAVAE
jgi:hypothetical protein